MTCKSADLCKKNLAVKVTPGQKKFGKLNKKGEGEGVGEKMKRQTLRSSSRALSALLR